MLLGELPKKEQARILADMKDMFGKQTIENITKTGRIQHLWVDPDTLSPFLRIEYLPDKQSH